MYNLQKRIQLEIIPTSNTKNGNFKHSHYQSIYIAVFLAVQVFDCDVMGVPCMGLVCECNHNLKFVFCCNN